MKVCSKFVSDMSQVITRQRAGVAVQPGEKDNVKLADVYIKVCKLLTIIERQEKTMKSQSESILSLTGKVEALELSLKTFSVKNGRTTNEPKNLASRNDNNNTSAITKGVSVTTPSLAPDGLTAPRLSNASQSSSPLTTKLAISTNTKPGSLVDLKQNTANSIVPSTHNISAPKPIESKNTIDGDYGSVQRSKGRRRSIIVGQNSDADTALRGTQRVVDLHVYRLHPDTTPEILSDHLRPRFPEASCEPLISRRPEVYSSFKVTIHGDNFKQAMDPSCWPQGVCVAKFFRTNKTTSPRK